MTNSGISAPAGVSKRASSREGPREIGRSAPRSLLPYLQATAWVLAATAAAELLYRLTGSTRLSMVFLAGVLLTAYFVGSGPAYFAAGLAFLVYNFYLVEPRFTIEFTTAEDLLTLLVFLAVAMLTGSLTGRVKDEAAGALARARATRTLFDATREFAASSDEIYIRQRLADHLGAASGGWALVQDRTIAVTSPENCPPLPDQLVATARALEQEPSGAGADARWEGWSLRRLQVGDAALGVAGWRGKDGRRVSGDEEALLVIMSDAGAAAIARARLAADKAEAEARARTEELRNALLSSISHDLRTPLAAILASASSLQEFADAFDADTRRDLASTIKEEAERLDLFVANLLNMSRLEAGALTLQRTAFGLAEVVSRVLERRVRPKDRPVLVSIPRRLPECLGDPLLFEQALGNVVENALRYTPEGSTLTINAREEAGFVEVRVCDEGPGLPDAELQRIFDKFYRASTAAEKSGTGLGLSITRGLIEAMGGRVLAENRPDGVGLAITLSTPAAA